VGIYSSKFGQLESLEAASGGKKRISKEVATFWAREKIPLKKRCIRSFQRGKIGKIKEQASLGRLLRVTLVVPTPGTKTEHDIVFRTVGKALKTDDDHCRWKQKVR